MNLRRISHCILVGLGLALLGACWWWTARRLSPLTSGSRVPAANLPADKADAARVTNITGKSAPMQTAAPDRLSEDSPERRAQITRVVALERGLARDQEAALAGLEEHEYPSVLAVWANSQSEAIAAAAMARTKLLAPREAQDEPAPLAGAEALQVRFDAVRQSIIEGGLSIEEAETRFKTARPGP